jgi:hypothetical protein
MYQLCTFIHLPSYNKLTYASNDNPILHIKIELYKGQTKKKKKKKDDQKLSGKFFITETYGILV